MNIKATLIIRYKIISFFHHYTDTNWAEKMMNITVDPYLIMMMKN